MPLRVLVVDDSAAMRMALQRAIELSGLPIASCLTAEHGRAALSILADHAIDLLLVDLDMPEMNGAELIRRLQQDPERRQIPFIVMSADATANRVEELLELGALAYLPKPFGAEALRSEMLKAMERMHVCN